jgi:hypothetical protein
MFNYRIFNTVITVIYRYLDLTDLVSCSLVDTKLSDMTRKYMGKKYHYRTVTPYSRSITLWTDNQPDRPCPWVKRVVCSSRMISCGRIARLFPNVEELEMKFSKMKGYKWLVNLKTLILHNDYPGTIKQVFGNWTLPRLEKLIIKFEIDLDLADQCPNLKHFESRGKLTIGKNKLNHVDVSKFCGKVMPGCSIRERMNYHDNESFPNEKDHNNIDELQLCLGEDCVINGSNVRAIDVNSAMGRYTITTTTLMPKCEMLCLWGLRDHSIINWCPNVTDLTCGIITDEFKVLVNLEHIYCEKSEFSDFTQFTKLEELTVILVDGPIRSGCTELKTYSNYKKICPRVTKYNGSLPLPTSNVLREIITEERIFGKGCYPTIRRVTLSHYNNAYAKITDKEIKETFPNLTHIRVCGVKVSKKFHSDKIVSYRCKDSTCIMENFPNATYIKASTVDIDGPSNKLQKLCVMDDICIDENFGDIFPNLTHVAIDIELQCFLQHVPHLETLKLYISTDTNLFKEKMKSIVNNHSNLTRIKVKSGNSLDPYYKEEHRGIRFIIDPFYYG